MDSQKFISLYKQGLFLFSIEEPDFRTETRLERPTMIVRRFQLLMTDIRSKKIRNFTMVEIYRS